MESESIMTEAIIGLFAAGAVGIYFILKDAFSRDESGRYKITKGFYRKLLSLEGYGSLLTLSAFSQSNDVTGKRSFSKGEGIQKSSGVDGAADARSGTKRSTRRRLTSG
ncbi:MAG: hypothetical protein WKF84_11210 [Pyrinomonadaceae bacterium]